MQQQNAKIASMARAMGVFKAEIDQIKIYNIYIYIYIYIFVLKGYVIAGAQLWKY
jgi:hypothetical protein